MNTLTKDQIKKIFIKVKPTFKEKLGKYTHKKISDNWYFHSLAFTHTDWGYVFGFNIGFFKYNGNYYNHIGMNVTVRSDGDGIDARSGYIQFFREHLKDWMNVPEITYTDPIRGGLGVVFPKYRRLDSFASEKEMEEFFDDCINYINKLYGRILENPNNIFDNVVRAAPFWDESIIEICEERVIDE